MAPSVDLMRPRTQRPTVVLPEPDSPTSESVSPLATEKLTPFTACTTERGARDGEVLDQPVYGEDGAHATRSTGK